MNLPPDIENYVNEPSELVELCRAVFEQLASKEFNDAEKAQQLQLREIAKAIERLEKLGVPVPDPLRAEKTRLAAILSSGTEDQQALRYIVKEFENLVQELSKGLGLKIQSSSTTRRRRQKRSGLPKTDKETLRNLILTTLKKHGGRSVAIELVKDIEEQLEGKFLPGDLEMRMDGSTIAWKNNLNWQRFFMVKEGILKSNSPRGIWELKEDIV